LTSRSRSLLPVQKNQRKFDDKIEVKLTVEESKEKSTEYGFRILREESGELLAKGYVVIVAADRLAGKAVQIPKEIVETLKPFCK